MWLIEIEIDGFGTNADDCRMARAESCQPPRGGVIIVDNRHWETSGWQAERTDVMSSYITATVKGAK
jgi:hypothetical protein